MLLQMPKFHSLWWLSSIPLGASQLALVVKNAPANAEQQEMWFPSLDQEDHLDKGMATTPVFFPGKFYEQRSLVATVHSVSESDMTENIEHEQYSIVYTSLSIHLLMGI